jgi:hypothetical protein
MSESTELAVAPSAPPLLPPPPPYVPLEVKECDDGDDADDESKRPRRRRQRCRDKCRQCHKNIGYGDDVLTPCACKGVIHRRCLDCVRFERRFDEDGTTKCPVCQADYDIVEDGSVCGGAPLSLVGFIMTVLSLVALNVAIVLIGSSIIGVSKVVQYPLLDRWSEWMNTDTSEEDPHPPYVVIAYTFGLIGVLILTFVYAVRQPDKNLCPKSVDCYCCESECNGCCGDTPTMCCGAACNGGSDPCMCIGPGLIILMLTIGFVAVAIGGVFLIHQRVVDWTRAQYEWSEIECARVQSVESQTV